MLKLIIKTVNPSRALSARPDGRWCVLPLLPVIALLAVLGCTSGKPQGGPVAKDYKAAPETLVKDLTIGTGRVYRWLPFQEGYPLFTDRDYFYGAVPARYAGFPMLLTACDDKLAVAEESLVSFTTLRPVRVFVLHSAVVHSGIAGQLWLNEAKGWKEEPWKVGTSMGTAQINKRLVWSKAYTAGERVELGGPGCKEDACETYSLLVTPEPLP